MSEQIKNNNQAIELSDEQLEVVAGGCHDYCKPPKHHQPCKPHKHHKHHKC